MNLGIPIASAVSPPRLDSLPSEVLLGIFSHLAPRPSTKPPATSDEIEEDENVLLNVSLRNLKFVCRRFSALVTPLIQAHYSDADIYHLRMNGSQLALWEKVKTVIMDNHLARFNAYEFFREHLSLHDIDQQLGLSEVWEEGVLDTEAFHEALAYNYGVDKQMQSNYERAAILCLTSNVEEIAYGSSFEDSWREYSEDKDIIAIEPIIYAGRGDAFGKVHKFEHLRFLSIDIQHMWIGKVSPVLRLPSLQHLVLEWRDWGACGFDGFEIDDGLQNWGCPESSSNVHTLELRNFKASGSVAAQLIRSCQALKSFSIDSSILGDVLRFHAELFDELERQSTTLEELVVTSQDTKFGDNSPAITETTLLSFKNLKHLQVPFRLITGYGSEDNDVRAPPLPDFCAILPPSIASIKFGIMGPTPYENTTSAFTNLLRQEHKVLPCLRSVHVNNHTIQEMDYDITEEEYSLPMDLPSLSRLFPDESSICFNYTLIDCNLLDTAKIESARASMLRHPHGKELIRHSTCNLENRWNALLSRDVGTPLPSRVNIEYDDVKERGWLKDSLSAEGFAEKVKIYEQ